MKFLDEKITVAVGGWTTITTGLHPYRVTNWAGQTVFVGNIFVANGTYGVTIDITDIAANMKWIPTLIPASVPSLAGLSMFDKFTVTITMGSTNYTGTSDIVAMIYRYPNRKFAMENVPLFDFTEGNEHTPIQLLQGASATGQYPKLTPRYPWKDTNTYRVLSVFESSDTTSTTYNFSTQGGYSGYSANRTMTRPATVVGIKLHDIVDGSSLSNTVTVENEQTRSVTTTEPTRSGGITVNIPVARVASQGNDYTATPSAQPLYTFYGPDQSPEGYTEVMGAPMPKGMTKEKVQLGVAEESQYVPGNWYYVSWYEDPAYVAPAERIYSRGSSSATVYTLSCHLPLRTQEVINRYNRGDLIIMINITDDDADICTGFNGGQIYIYVNSLTSDFIGKTLDVSISWSRSQLSDPSLSGVCYTSFKARKVYTIYLNSMSVTRDSVLVDNITLDKHNETVYVNGQLTLNATITPNNADEQRIRWTSENSEIASAPNTSGTVGVVTANYPGITEITATAWNVPDAYDTCRINVIPVPPTYLEGGAGNRLAVFDTDCIADYYLQWQDRYGSFQSQPFDKVATFSEDISQSNITNYANEQRPYNIVVTPKWKIQSDWIDEDIYPFYESIFVSPTLTLYDTKEDVAYPVLINSKYTEKTFKNQHAFFNLSLDLTLNKNQNIIY